MAFFKVYVGKGYRKVYIPTRVKGANDCLTFITETFWLFFRQAFANNSKAFEDSLINPVLQFVNGSGGAQRSTALSWD